ncbi:hypothetical protein BO221_02840 [Archangium sp. Cb G35]|uniref:hypothetical protein n=1 Tax=Archangium sp. Cb G35 TaxID=1920190 RepID=UPI000936E794|nr:hypothetical protein [Archangium sp. Cb G35]OJT26959.1 hypothetical protein BO221_02840 [Archangium sp. Cb G35]
MKRSYPIVSLLLVLLTIGCGPAGQSFHGTYSASGTTTLSITGYTSETAQVTGVRHISEGAASDLIISDSSGQCFLPANLEGDVAALSPGASCTQTTNGVTLTMSITTGTASLSGKVVELRLAGNVTVTYQGKSYSGTFSENSTLTRVAK